MYIPQFTEVDTVWSLRAPQVVTELTVCVKPQEELVGQLIICLLIKIHFVTYSLVFFLLGIQKKAQPLAHYWPFLFGQCTQGTDKHRKHHRSTIILLTLLNKCMQL